MSQGRIAALLDLVPPVMRIVRTDGREALQKARPAMKDEIGIDHATVEIEDKALSTKETVLHV